VFFDGTLWQDDEMIRLGVGSKTGRRMGHMSMSGDDGTIAAFRDLDVKRRISHQQFEPGSARRISGTAARRSRGLGDRL
jgi:pyrroloquinoline quinone biosynthesis protein B